MHYFSKDRHRIEISLSDRKKQDAWFLHELLNDSYTLDFEIDWHQLNVINCNQAGWQVFLQQNMNS